MSVGQEFAVSAVAAGMSHILHHPLYTLKSQMMYYGPEFRIKTFISNVKHQKSFLYRGKAIHTNPGSKLVNSLHFQGLQGVSFIEKIPKVYKISWCPEQSPL